MTFYKCSGPISQKYKVIREITEVSKISIFEQLFLDYKCFCNDSCGPTWRFRMLLIQ